MATAKRDVYPWEPPPAAEPPRDVLSSDIDGKVVVYTAGDLGAGDLKHDAWRHDRPKWRPREGWEIGLAIAGWPLVWATGFTQFAFAFLGLWLAWKLWKRGNVRFPDGFWIWAGFLALVLISGFAIDVHASGTVASSGVGRYLAFVFRFLNYLGVTTVMLYIGNLSEAMLPRKRVIKWLAALGAMTTAIGLLAILLPRFGFPTLFSFVAPSSLLGDDGAYAKLAQVQPVLDSSAGTPRPSAPFAFTNAWGNNLSLLLVFVVVVAIAIASTRRKRMLAWSVVALAVIPIVYSLNRGVWTGIGLAVVVLAVRLALRGKTTVLVAIVVALGLGAMVFAFSPLGTLVQERLNAGHSNSIRESLAQEAIRVGKQSPIIGFGSTRETLGSDASIMIGPSSNCPKCGNRNIGSTGQLWLLLIAQGFLGAGLYLAFLLRSLWAYRHDASIIGIAGTLVIMLELYYSLYYSALAMPLAITMAAIGLLWRNQRLRSGLDPSVELRVPARQPALTGRSQWGRSQ